MSSELPSYEELSRRTDAPPGSAWGIFGPEDELGTVALLTPERIAAAAGLVRKGASFSLDYPVNAFDPPFSPLRSPARQVIFGRHDNHRDDYLDSFYLQSTSQIDGLRHQRHPEFGFYNGTADEAITVGTPTLGIQRWADKPIVGRGVLLDVQRTLARRGRTLDYAAGEAFGPDVLDLAAADAQIQLREGDILLVHTGWCGYYFNELDDAGRRALPSDVRSSGLAASREMLAWLWDHHFSVVASDTVAVESEPAVPDSPFDYAFRHMMHQDLIPLLGICLGELWRLDELAADCAQDGVYEFMVVAKPLDLVGGVGSPPNATALK
jgi:kynurenine formamidase